MNTITLQQVTCEYCQELKPLDEFSTQTNGKSGRYRWCKECAKKKTVRNRKLHAQYPNTLTPNEAGEALGMSGASVRRLCEAGVINAINFGFGSTKHWRITHDSLISHLRSTTVSEPEPELEVFDEPWLITPEQVAALPKMPAVPLPPKPDAHALIGQTISKLRAAIEILGELVESGATR